MFCIPIALGRSSHIRARSETKFTYVKKQESLVGFEHQICEYLSDVVFDSVVNQCTGKAVPHELSSALSMHKKVVGGTQFS